MEWDKVCVLEVIRLGIGNEICTYRLAIERVVSHMNFVDNVIRLCY